MSKTVPVVNRNRGFKVWLRNEIYDGPMKPGNQVPNVDDLVLDWSTGFWRVVSVDHYKTNMSLLVRSNIAALSGGIDDSDKTILTNLASNSNPFRIYIDTSVIPHTLTIDSRWVRFGTANTHVKVFKGTSIDAVDGVVVSAMLNSAGNITSENIPLETVVIPNGTNVAMKTPRPAWCSETLANGEEAMVVTYTADGRITSIDKFIVVLTNFTRTTDQHQKYVSTIELLTPFMSKTDTRLIECPINMVSQSLQFTAKVTYTDGTSAELPIDGKKVTIAGLTTFVASQIGQVTDIVLTYHLSDKELALRSTQPLPERRITQAYKLKTMDVNSYYDVKLFVVPYWSNGRYQLRWFLYNLARDNVVDVTNHIEYGVGDKPFDGMNFTSTQNLRVAFNMLNLGGQYSYYRHTQNVAITLKAPASSSNINTYFTVAYSDTNVFGDNVKMRFTTDPARSNAKRINISCGHTDTLSWLTHLYNKVEPIYYPSRESAAPTPTHAKIYIGDKLAAEVPMANVVNNIDNVTVSVAQGSPVRVELIAKEGNLTQYLAMIPMVASAT